MTRLFSCFFLFFIQSLFAISTYEGDPQAFVMGVNVIEGTFTSCDTDLYIPTPTPLVLSRKYASCDGTWSLFPHTRLIAGQDNNQNSLFAGEKCGTFLPYEELKEGVYQINFNNLKGAANTSCGEISGQTHLGNKTVAFDPEKNTFLLTSGDGSQRLYVVGTKVEGFFLEEAKLADLASKFTDPRYYQLSWEKLPNGNCIEYTYTSEGRLSTVSYIAAEHVIYTIAFSYLDDQITALGSDGKEVHYYFQQGHLGKVERTEGANVAYEYNEEGKLTRIVLPCDRTTIVSYNSQGKVKSIAKPINTPNPQIVASFVYHDKHTEVTTSQKTRYNHDDQKRLTQVDHLDLEGQLHQVEKIYWGEKEEAACNLVGKTTEDGQGQIWSYKSYHYDSNFNLSRTSLFGSLTGESSIPIDLSPIYDKKSGTERVSFANKNKIQSSSTFTNRYTKNGFNLIFASNKSHHHYLPDTNLLTEEISESLAAQAAKQQTSEDEENKPSIQGKQCTYFGN